MARQTGANQYRGKREGYCGYVIKGKEGAFVRKINPNMSTRVKTEEKFANTRKYASKFGMLRGFTAYASKCLTNTKSVRGGQSSAPNLCTDSERMQKEVYQYLNKYLALDTTHTIGLQELSGSNWQSGVVDIVNKYSRSKYFDNVGFVEKSKINDSALLVTKSVEAELIFNPQMFANAIAAGYDNIAIQLYVCSYYRYYDPTAEIPLVSDFASGLLISRGFALNNGVDLTGSLNMQRGFWANSNGTNKMHMYVMRYQFYKGAVQGSSPMLGDTGYYCWTGDISSTKTSGGLSQASPIQ